MSARAPRKDPLFSAPEDDPTDADPVDSAEGLTIAQVAKRLGMRKDSVKWHMRQGRLPSATKDANGHWRFDADEVRRLAAERKAASQATGKPKSPTASADAAEERAEREHQKRMAAMDAEFTKRSADRKKKWEDEAAARKRRDDALAELHSLTLDEYQVGAMLGRSGSDIRLLAGMNQIRPTPVPEHLREPLRGETVGARYTREEVSRFAETVAKGGATFAAGIGNMTPTAGVVERLGHHVLDIVLGKKRDEEGKK